MSVAHEIAGDVAAAATALAGLLLVFLGAVSTSYESYDAVQQASVRPSFRQRAFLAFAGFLLSLFAAILALAGKWYECDLLVAISLPILTLGFVTAGIAAFTVVKEFV